MTNEEKPMTKIDELIAAHKAYCEVMADPEADTYQLQSAEKEFNDLALYDFEAIQSMHLENQRLKEIAQEMADATEDLQVMTVGLIEAIEKKMEWWAVEGRTENVLVVLQDTQKSIAKYNAMKGQRDG